jgi:hypothetical protein
VRYQIASLFIIAVLLISSFPIISTSAYSVSESSYRVNVNHAQSQVSSDHSNIANSWKMLKYVLLQRQHALLKTSVINAGRTLGVTDNSEDYFPSSSRSSSGVLEYQFKGEFHMFLPLIRKSDPVGYGLAAQYPSDVGIKNHPSVIYASSFEAEDWYEQDFGYTGWVENKGYQTTDPRLVLSGSGSLEYQNEKGEHHPQTYKFAFEDTEVVYLRWYRKYQPGYDFSCPSKTNGVYARGPGGYEGGKPTGYNKFSTKLTVWEHDGGGFEPKFYFYHPEQPQEWGEALPQNVGEPWILETDRWYSFEIMLKPNDAGQRNGETKLWIDGMLKGHYTGLRFRDTDDLKINELDITAYMGGKCTAPKDQNSWDDNLVLATEYIGPMVTSEDIIIDDSDDGFSTSYSQDAWQEYIAVGGQHYASSHYYNLDIGTGQDTATWSFVVPEPGNYDVYAWWWEGDWRPADVPYTINHSSGSTTVRVDQRENGGQWNRLGTFHFQDGGSVTVSDDVTSGEGVVADAIRLVER